MKILHYKCFKSPRLTYFSPTDDHNFSEATAVLFSWIDRGEVNRRTANHFYSMIQSANSHVRRLMGEKAQHEEEMERAKEIFKNALMAILTQCKYFFLFQTVVLTILRQAATCGKPVTVKLFG